MGDSLWYFALPVGADQQIETGRRPVHLSKLNETIGAQINDLVNPEAVAEIRNLYHYRREIERNGRKAIDHILVGTGDSALRRIHIVREHGIVVERSNDEWPRPHRLLYLTHYQPTVIDVDHRPGPEIGVTRHHTRISLGNLHTGVRAGCQRPSQLRRRSDSGNTHSFLVVFSL